MLESDGRKWLCRLTWSFFNPGKSAMKMWAAGVSFQSVGVFKTGHWLIIERNGSKISWRIKDMFPMKIERCENWFEKCGSDFWCICFGFFKIIFCCGIEGRREMGCFYEEKQKVDFLKFLVSSINGRLCEY